MKSLDKVAERLNEAVRSRNRELFTDAVIKLGTGIVFSLLTFGFIFWVGWFLGIFFAYHLELSAVTFGLIVTAIFFVVALWSAWRNVNPLADLQPLTDRQMLMTMLSLASPNLLYFSPEHASAGFAMVLIGGPANILSAFGIWAHRLKADTNIIAEGAGMLDACADGCPPERVRSLDAAVLLRRLSLIKMAVGKTGDVIVLTERGRTILKKEKRKRDTREPA